MRCALEKIRRAAVWVLPTALLLAMLAPSPAAATDADELKAVFVVKIVRFVEWPEGSFDTDTSPIRVGVLGESDGFDFGTLRRVLGASEVNGRKFSLLRISGPEATSNLHIVIVTEESRGAQRRLANAFEKLPVLSIGPSFRFAEYGGTIGMELYQGKIAFDVNHAAARDAGLRISSKVLKLATTVY